MTPDPTDWDHRLVLAPEAFGPCAKRQVFPHIAPEPGMQLVPTRALPVATVLAVASLLVSPVFALALGAFRDQPVNQESLRTLVPAGPASPLVWSNGAVRLAFPQGTPSFAVQSLADGRVASNCTVSGIAEVAPSGAIDEFASFASPAVHWSFARSALSATLTVRVQATVPVLASEGTWDTLGLRSGPSEVPVGNASVSLVFVLPNGSATPSDTARFSVSLAGWPWEDDADSLGLELSVHAGPATHIALGGAEESLVEVDNASGSTVSTLFWEPNASAAFANGTSGISTVGSQRNVSSAEGVVRILFAAVAGGYSELSYDPSVTLNVGAFLGAALPAWVFTPASVVVILGAGSVAAALGVVALRRRSGPAEGEPDRDARGEPR